MSCAPNSATLRIEHGQDVDRARGHLNLREFVGALGLGHGIGLAIQLLRGLASRDQGALDIAEGGQHRLVIGGGEFGVARLP